MVINKPSGVRPPSGEHPTTVSSILWLPLGDLRINKIPIFDEKRGIAALLIKNSGFYFVCDP